MPTEIKFKFKDSYIFYNLHTACKRVRKFQIFNYTLVLLYGEFTLCITSVIIAKRIITIQIKLNIFLLCYQRSSIQFKVGHRQT